MEGVELHELLRCYFFRHYYLQWCTAERTFCEGWTIVRAAVFNWCVIALHCGVFLRSPPPRSRCNFTPPCVAQHFEPVKNYRVKCTETRTSRRDIWPEKNMKIYNFRGCFSKYLEANQRLLCGNCQWAHGWFCVILHTIHCILNLSPFDDQNSCRAFF